MNKLVARLLILTVCLAVANADLYPFIPFGLFACFGLLVLARWLWTGTAPIQQDDPSHGGNFLIIILYGFLQSFCALVALDVHISIKITHRGILNACVVGMFLLLCMIKDPKRMANQELKAPEEPSP